MLHPGATIARVIVATCQHGRQSGRNPAKISAQWMIFTGSVTLSRGLIPQAKTLTEQGCTVPLPESDLRPRESGHWAV